MNLVRTIQVTFDCADPRRLSEFWCTALGYRLAAYVHETEGNEHSAAEDPRGNGPRIFFQRVPEAKAVKNRLHLDVRAAPGLSGDERMTALEAECERLVGHGARRLQRLEATDEDEGIIVMADPEGNEFCLD